MTDPNTLNPQSIDNPQPQPIVSKQLQPEKSDLRAMLLGFYVDDCGRAIDDAGNVVEDGAYQLTEGRVRRPWPNLIVRHKQTGKIIDEGQYHAIPAEQQEDYEFRRYLDIIEDGHQQLRIIEGDAYARQLLADDIAAFDPIVCRYLIECGAGIGDFLRGRLYDYRETVATAAQESGIISSDIAAEIEKGNVHSIGQLWLTCLEALRFERTMSLLSRINDRQSNALKIMLTLSDDELDDELTAEDVVWYRDYVGDGLDGLIYHYYGEGKHAVIPSFDPECGPGYQWAYICDELLPEARRAVAKALGCLGPIEPAAMENSTPACISLARTLSNYIKHNPSAIIPAIEHSDQ